LSASQAWRLQDHFISTLCLDLGVHLHHLAGFLTGQEPSSVLAEFNNFSEYPDLVDTVNLWLRYPSGMRASLWASKTTIGNRNGLRIRVFGDCGSAEWIQLEPEELRLNFIDGARLLTDRGSRHRITSGARYNRMKAGHPSGFIEAFANLYADMADALISWRQTKSFAHPYVYGLDHAADGLSLFHAVRLADNQGQWTDVKDLVLLPHTRCAV
jgi:predicted dehydrogenase